MLKSMYIPKHFEVNDPAALWVLMREFNFALLITAPDGVPFASSIPFGVDANAQRLSGHLAKANPQCQHLQHLEQTNAQALIVFQAEHALVSSRWYETAPNVPTWNYAVVHARVRPRELNAASTRAQLEALMRDHGHAQEMQALPEEYLKKMQHGIVAFEFEVLGLEGKFKLSQNRNQQDQQNVMQQLAKQGELERGVAARMQQNLERQ